jgi:F0F1-type ATP synthase delta subunit
MAEKSQHKLPITPEMEAALKEWEEEQRNANSILKTNQPAKEATKKPEIKESDSWSNIKARAERNNDYMRNGS